MKNKSNIITFAIIATLALFSLGFMIYPMLFPNEQLEAVITVEGHEPTIIDLASAEDQVIDLHELYPVHITVEVVDHSIRFVSSDCPDKICIQAGYLANDLDMAACIPNKTAIFVQKLQK